MSQLIVEFKDMLVHELDQHKAENITVIDLKNKSNIADFMIIATGRSNKHVAATAEIIIDKIKDSGRKCYVEGLGNSDWVLVDALDVLVHIFNKEKREYYALEEMWQA